MKKQEFINKINAALPRGLIYNKSEIQDDFILYITSKQPISFCDEFKRITESVQHVRLTICTKTLYSVAHLALITRFFSLPEVAMRVALRVKDAHETTLKEVRAYKTHLKTKKGQRERAQKLVADIIGDHEKYKKSFFWTPARCASQRRNNEWSRDVSFTAQGAVYTVSQDYSESCRNCYYNCDIFVNGAKKDIRALKKLVVA